MCVGRLTISFYDFQAFFARPVLTALVFVSVMGFAGCENGGPFVTDSRRKPIEPAPVGLPSSGIGAPGGASADTRSIGTVASSEGQDTASSPAAGTGIGTTSGTHR